jgi:hypothetical protein
VYSLKVGEGHKELVRLAVDAAAVLVVEVGPLCRGIKSELMGRLRQNRSASESDFQSGNIRDLSYVTE